MTPLKLFWWNKHPNFGDAINPDIAAHVSGRSVEWAHPSDCELVSIGSVMQIVAPFILKKVGPPKVIWGSGLMGPTPEIAGFKDSGHVEIVSTRGPLSALFSGFPGVPMSDPGLLVDRVYGKVDKKYRIGFVPHHSQWRNRDFVKTIHADKRIKLIDVRNPAGGEVVREIAACDYVISCSLHGLIVADAYGIPNFWSDGPGFGLSDLKFHDYALSVGRSLLRTEAFETCIARINARDFDSFWYLRRLEPIKDAIEAAFPASLRA